MDSLHPGMESLNGFHFCSRTPASSCVNYDTAWNILMKMRSMMINVVPDQFMDGITEIDEAWIGRKKNQDIVFGIVERTKKKLQFVLIPNTKETTIRRAALKHVKKQSIFNTDGAKYYGFASVNYEQNSTIHSQKNSPNLAVSTRTPWNKSGGTLRALSEPFIMEFPKLIGFFIWLNTLSGITLSPKRTYSLLPSFLPVL